MSIDVFDDSNRYIHNLRPDELAKFSIGPTTLIPPSHQEGVCP